MPSHSQLSLTSPSPIVGRCEHIDPVTVITDDSTLTTLEPLASSSGSCLPCSTVSTSIQVPLELQCVPDQHATRQCLSLPLSLAGERQAWLDACALQVPGSKARVLHRVMWDTGSSINVVSDKIYRRLGSPNLSVCQGTSVRTVTGTTQTVLGIVSLEVHVCACAHFLADFHVVDVPDTVLISFPQIRKLEATIGKVVRIPWKTLLPVSALSTTGCNVVSTSASPSSGVCVTQVPACGPLLPATAILSVPPLSIRSSPSCDRLPAASAALLLSSSSETSSARDVPYSSRQSESIPNSDLTLGTAPAGPLPAASSIAATMPIDQSNSVSSRSSPDVLTIAATLPISPVSSEQIDVRNLDSVKMPPRCERWIHADVPAGFKSSIL